MFFQAILCINFPQPKRKEANRKGRWHPWALTWDRTNRRTFCSTAQTPTAKVSRQWQQFDASSNTLYSWRDSLAMFFLQTVTTKEKWFQKLGDVFPMQPQSSNLWVSLSLSKTISLFQPQSVTLPNLSSSCWFLTALHQFTVCFSTPHQISLYFFSTYLSSSALRFSAFSMLSQRWRKRKA